MAGEGRISCCCATLERPSVTNRYGMTLACGNDAVVAIRRVVYDVLDGIHRHALALMEDELEAHALIVCALSYG
jgi:hypothetical protein